VSRLVPRRRSILAALAAVVLLAALAAGLTRAGSASAARAPLPNRPGAPVTSFGEGGKVHLAPPVGLPTASEHLVVDPEGRMLLLTRTKEAESFVTRLLPSGATDPGFAAGGWVAVPAGEWDEIALDPEGRILLSGSVEGDFAVARLTPEGAPDPTFGDAGVARVHVGAPWAKGLRGEALTRLVALPDGDVLGAGSAGYCYPGNCSTGSGVVVEFTAAGALDTSFGEGGVVQVAEATQPVPGKGKGILRDADALAVQPDGKILVGGSDYRHLVVVRLTATGAVDTNFGEGGTFWTARETEGEEDNLYYPGEARGLLLERSGRIVVLGAKNLFGLRPDGHLDPRFGYPESEAKFKGVSPLYFGVSPSSSTDALLDTEDRIIVVGNFGVARFLPNGQSDARFGGGGLMRVRLGNAPVPPETEYSEPLASVAQAPGGDLVAAGYDYFNRRHPRTYAVVIRRNDLDGRFARCGGSRAVYQGTPRSDGLGWVFGTLVTFAGNDKIAGAQGAVCAGAGNDTVLNRTNFYEPIYLGPGDDRSIGSSGRIFGGPGNDRIELGKYANGPNVAKGGPGSDLLVGSGEADRLEGGPGNDVLIGGAGRDVLVGGPGNDTLIGSKNDVFRPGPGHNRIVIRPAGKVTVRDSAPWLGWSG
jgi:uncharacterized delta-60 repeat protein